MNVSLNSEYSDRFHEQTLVLLREKKKKKGVIYASVTPSKRVTQLLSVKFGPSVPLLEF